MAILGLEDAPSLALVPAGFLLPSGRRYRLESNATAST
jgi:hypothetical protein